MPRVYRKVILGVETNFFHCENCLNEANQPQMGWISRYVEAVVPGDGNAGVWKEAPLEKCDMCFAVDLLAQEEMHQWCHDIDQQTWEEDQKMWEDHIASDTSNPQEMKKWNL